MRKLFFPLLLFVSGLLSAQTEITLYVSPSGSDHHPGTAEKPMATLEYAWKKASRQAGRRSITIYCEGTNYLSAPILITNETSGTPEHPIRFSSYPGQKVWRANLCATFLGNLVYPTPASKMLHFP